VIIVRSIIGFDTDIINAVEDITQELLATIIRRNILKL